ncbi:MAG: tRNA uridine-5-carboxymethylaminomethyl(34) synthesis GTPase MnmE, partial [Bacteroides sp.]|nr:tRNA uridine-5-carboxymethylaminomethyl(34) synthesis GTPase MnmE [Bacteroides sp.]MCM1414258.1 tRNA uridine-5-carboxymethylaminomethyl(34) synthesis GTPase MnmE [Bacteroides sp.]
MSETICAISTPPGIGGIAVARVSGDTAIATVAKCWRGCDLSKAVSHTAHLGTIVDVDGKDLDQAVVTLFRAPRSFTGEDVVEISVHGSKFVQRELINTLIASGARLAEAGEFTRRAFANGRMDLAEAEAVADVIASNSRSAHRIAMSQMRGGVSKRLKQLRDKLVDLTALLELELDFSEEEVEFADRKKLIELAMAVNKEVRRLHDSYRSGRAIKEGIPVAIVGATNAGKSSLLNALLDDERAIVSDIHGTTRDTIEETMEIGDYLFRFIDTAGLRSTTDTIERIGIERSLSAIEKARIIVCVIDATAPIDNQILAHATIPLTDQDSSPFLIIALNKTDLKPNTDTLEKIEDTMAQLRNDTAHGHVAMIRLSASTRAGLDKLNRTLQSIAAIDNGAADSDGVMIINARHAAALSEAAKSSARAIASLEANIPGDLVAQDIRETIHHLATITGDIPSTEILAAIFSRFCIG